MQKLAENLAKGFAELNLIPEIEQEGKKWRFMGIFAKNREEWALTQFANFHMDVTQATFYDTLGPDAASFIMEQTGLTTISISGDYVKMLTKMKKDLKSG